MLVAKPQESSIGYSEPLHIAEGDMVELIYSGAGSHHSIAELEVTVDGTVSIYSYYSVVDSKDATPKFAGPCTVRAKGTDILNHAMLTVAIHRGGPNTPSAVPTNAAVIPEDANGQFQVILESSTDTITWSPAMPGSYGGSTQKRFFRTRIVKTN